MQFIMPYCKRKVQTEILDGLQTAQGIGSRTEPDFQGGRNSVSAAGRISPPRFVFAPAVGPRSGIAEGAIDEAIKLQPGDADCYDTRGEILLKKGDTKAALKMWKKVLEINPDYLSDYKEGTELYNGLKQKGLITE